MPTDVSHPHDGELVLQRSLSKSNWLATLDGKPIVARNSMASPDEFAAHADLGALATLADVRSPLLVPFLGTANFEGALWFLSAKVHGASLRRLLSLATLTPLQAAYIGARVLEGIAHLHKIGLAHGRVHAGNVLIDHSGQPVLSDWALSTLRPTGDFDELRHLDIDGARGLLSALVRSADRPVARNHGRHDRIFATMDQIRAGTRTVNPARAVRELDNAILATSGDIGTLTFRGELAALVAAMNRTSAPMGEQPAGPNADGSASGGMAGDGTAADGSAAKTKATVNGTEIWVTPLADGVFRPEGIPLAGRVAGVDDRSSSSSKAAAHVAPLLPAGPLSRAQWHQPHRLRRSHVLAIAATVVALVTAGAVMALQPEDKVDAPPAGAAKPSAKPPAKKPTPAKPKIQPVPNLAPGSAGFVSGVVLRPLASCEPGSACPITVTIRLGQLSRVENMNWEFVVVNRCSGTRTTVPGGSMFAEPGWPSAFDTRTVQLPAGRALAVVGLTTTPVRVASPPLTMPARGGSC